jgi:hypothetical protein
MIVGAFLGLFFIPLFFVVVQKIFRRKAPAHDERAADTGRAPVPVKR